jgi:RES domain-containing protein
MYPGRWNTAGQRVIYAAPTLALAVLESAAHIDDNGLPLNKYVIEIDVPEAIWQRRTSIAAHTLPVGWDAIPAGIVSFAIGSKWVASGASALLEVPSAIVPEEFIVLINAAHPDATAIRAHATRRFHYHALFRAK